MPIIGKMGFTSQSGISLFAAYQSSWPIIRRYPLNPVCDDASGSKLDLAVGQGAGIRLASLELH
jgi:hypothetical protein